MSQKRARNQVAARVKTADERLLRGAALRLGLQFAAVILAIVVLVGLVAFALVSASIASSTDRSLDAASQDRSGDESPPGTFIITVHDGHVASSESLPPGLPDRDALSDVASTGGVINSAVDSDLTTFAVRTTTHDGMVVQVAIDQAGSNAELKRLLFSLAAAGIVGTLFAAIAGYLLARRAIKPLVESLALQRRFVADASHELRTPLTLLSTRVQMLRRALVKEGSQTAAAEVEQIEGDTKALTGILEDLLISSDNRETGLAEVDLALLAVEAVSAVTAAADERSIAVTAEIPDQRGTVAGLEAPLRRVYLSLLSNALDHARSSVVVRVIVAAHTIAVEVIDDGPGFPDGMRPFERFSSNRPASDGARHYGLGLALAADVATRFDGKVEVVNSRPGGIVRLEFPRLSHLTDNEGTE